LYHKSVTSFQDHIPAKFHEYTPIGSLVTDKNQRGCFFMKHGVFFLEPPLHAAHVV